jgi:hypothetical protein
VRRGNFTSLTALIMSLHDHLRAWAQNPTLFLWTNTPEQVLSPYQLDISGTEHQRLASEHPSLFAGRGCLPCGPPQHTVRREQGHGGEDWQGKRIMHRDHYQER